MRRWRCAVCDAGLSRPRDTDAPSFDARRRRAGMPVCRRCFAATVTIRTAAEERLGARTFYVSSWDAAGPFYTVKVWNRHRAGCTCPDHTHRGQILGVPCKHIRLVRLLARAAGGWSRIGRGLTMTFSLAAGSPTSRKERR